MRMVINKERFLNFLSAINKINDSFILDIDGDVCETIVVSDDETCFLYAVSPIEESLDDKVELNIPDCKKLITALKQIQDNTINLNLTTNAIQYKSSDIKFKYHLYDSSFLRRPKINPAKVKSFDFDIEVTLSKDDIKRIIKNASFVDQANKLYIYTDDGNLMGEITDRQRANTDVFGIVIKKGVDFNIDPIIIKLDNIQVLNLCNDDIKMKVNTSIGLISFEIELGVNKFIYILTSLKS